MGRYPRATASAKSGECPILFFAISFFSITIRPLGSNEYRSALSSASRASLSGRLDGATEKLDQGKPGQAIKKLNDFIREVEKLERKGQISSADADDLIAAAEAAIAEINGA